MALTGREMTEAARQAVSKIPNGQLQSQLAAGASVVVLDVREKEEWDAGHIPQGTNSSTRPSRRPRGRKVPCGKCPHRYPLRRRRPRCPGRADSLGDGLYECLLPVRWLYQLESGWTACGGTTTTLNMRLTYG